MKSRTETTDKTNLPNSPTTIIVLAMILAFFLFAGFDFAEVQLGSLIPPGSARALHFLWGFFATLGGMLLVWNVMRKKENELISLRKMLAAELERKTTALEESMRHSEREADRANTVSRTLHEQRQDFLSVLNHRLMNPLSANERTIKLMQEDAFGEVNQQQKEILKLLFENNREIIRLLKMLTNLYSFQTGNARLNQEKIPVSKLLKQVERVALENTSSKSPKLEFHMAQEHCSLSCDEVQVNTLLLHLIDNAMKYARSKVSVRVTCNDEKLRFCVEDDGRGIDQADIGDLFVRFYQISKSGRYPANTGVGLCLCREIALAHGGSISCEAIDGNNGGTRFIVELPCQCTDHPMKFESKARTESNRQMNHEK